MSYVFLGQIAVLMATLLLCFSRLVALKVFHCSVFLESTYATYKTLECFQLLLLFAFDELMF